MPTTGQVSSANAALQEESVRSRSNSQYCHDPLQGVASSQLDERLSRIETSVALLTGRSQAQLMPGVVEEKQRDVVGEQSMLGTSSILNEQLNGLLQRFEHAQVKVLSDHLCSLVERFEQSAQDLDFSVRRAVDLLGPCGDDDDASSQVFHLGAQGAPQPQVPPPLPQTETPVPRNCEETCKRLSNCSTGSLERKGRLEKILASGQNANAPGPEVSLSLEQAVTSHKETLANTLQVDLWGEKFNQLAKTGTSGAQEDALPSGPSARVLRSWRLACGGTVNLRTVLKFASALLITLNALYMGVQEHIEMVRTLEGEEVPGWLEAVDVTFTILIGAELVLSAGIYGKEFFQGDERWWNIFDILMVLSSIGEAAFEFLDLSFCRILRPLRMLRLLRVLRLFRSLTTLRLIAAMVGSSLLSVGWALLFLLMFAYMISIFIMQALTTYIKKYKVDSSAWLGDVRHFFGDLPTALYSLLASISGGVDWTDVASPLEPLGWVYQFAFLLFIMFTLFGLFNIMTGVFVESAKNVARVDEELVIQAELTTQTSFLNQLRSILRCSHDGSNKLSEQALKEALETTQVQAHLKSLGVDACDAMSVHKLLRGTHDTVDIDSFVMALLRLHGSAKAVDMITMIYDSKRASETNDIKLGHLSRQLISLRNMVSVQTESVKLLANNVEDLHGRVSSQKKYRSGAASHRALVRPRLPPQLE